MFDVVVLRPWPAPHWLHVVSASAKDPATRELRTRKLRDCPLTLLTQWAFDEGCVEDFSVVIDIGMNLGWFTALAAAHGLQVVAFEPSAAKVKYMAKTLELNGWDKVQLRHGGLATEGGQLFVDETRWWEKRSASREAGEGKTEATALRLDDVVSSSAKVCLLKADCRGCETEAFRSGERLLQAGAVQVVQMEYDHSEASRTALETLQSMSPRPWQCILLPTGLSCSGGDLADQKSEALQELWDFVVANVQVDCRATKLQELAPDAHGYHTDLWLVHEDTMDRLRAHPSFVEASQRLSDAQTQRCDYSAEQAIEQGVCELLCYRFASLEEAKRACDARPTCSKVFAKQDGFELRGGMSQGIAQVDEEQHKAYDPSYDVRRDFDTAASVALGSGHKLMVLRHNPDAFKIAGIAYEYICHLHDEKAPATKAQGFLQALVFSGGLLGVDMKVELYYHKMANRQKAAVKRLLLAVCAWLDTTSRWLLPAADFEKLELHPDEVLRQLAFASYTVNAADLERRVASSEGASKFRAVDQGRSLCGLPLDTGLYADKAGALIVIENPENSLMTFVHCCGWEVRVSNVKMKTKKVMFGVFHTPDGDGRQERSKWSRKAVVAWRPGVCYKVWQETHDETQEQLKKVGDLCVRLEGQDPASSGGMRWELIYQRLEDGPFALQSLDVIPQMGEIMKLGLPFGTPEGQRSHGATGTWGSFTALSRDVEHGPLHNTKAVPREGAYFRMLQQTYWLALHVWLVHSKQHMLQEHEGVFGSAICALITRRVFEWAWLIVRLWLRQEDVPAMSIPTELEHFMEYVFGFCAALDEAFLQEAPDGSAKAVTLEDSVLADGKVGLLPCVKQVLWTNVYFGACEHDHPELEELAVPGVVSSKPPESNGIHHPRQCCFAFGSEKAML
ncbi:unnamed protein product [Effrenium voratum]|uniref:Uncharacterized protein n=1 Tax=Effrenium voratum TaxID=2562239 RepID=A0AA36JJ15_9DINO|nr:unnamed protein product [Effrenium voratum]